MNDKKLYSTLIAPLTTEKTVIAADKYRKIGFKVSVDATKSEIKKAVEKLFNVVVDKVATINVKSKVKNFKQKAGKKSAWKKALITLHDGHDINTADFD